MSHLEAQVIIRNGEKYAFFQFMGTPKAYPIINPEGCRLGDQINISFNGRDEFVRKLD